MIVELSNRSQELLQSYLSICEPSLVALGPIVSKIDLATVLSLLHSKKNEPWAKELELVAAALSAELLKDIRLSLPKPVTLINNQETPIPWYKKTKFIALILAGIFVAACEGFDGVTTILSFLALPSIWVFIAGLAFSVLSVFIFCGYNLIQLAQVLGIKIFDGPKLLNSYLQQLHEIKYIRRQMEVYCLTELPTADLIAIEPILNLLQNRLVYLSVVSKQFDAALNSKTLRFIKSALSFLSGVLFFGGGFFAGQSTAVFIFGLIGAAVPALWPVLVFSCVVGLAALAVYWYMERPGLQKLISAWIGLDEEKVEQLCDSNKIENEDQKLGHLRNNVVGVIKSKAAARVEVNPVTNRYSFYRSFIQEKPEDTNIEADFVLQV
ncbi:MAG: hypothetical protein WC627_01890 [Legionella sp.]